MKRTCTGEEMWTGYSGLLSPGSRSQLSPGRGGRVGLLASCMIVTMISAASVEAAQPVDLLALRDAICEHETRTSPDPDAEVGRNSEFGKCQVKLSTARGLGFKDHPALLFIRSVNLYWADQMLKHCKQPPRNRAGEEIHGGYHTPEGLAYCYNGGRNRGRVNKSDAYVVAVMEIYRMKRKS